MQSSPTEPSKLGSSPHPHSHHSEDQQTSTLASNPGKRPSFRPCPLSPHLLLQCNIRPTRRLLSHTSSFERPPATVTPHDAANAMIITTLVIYAAAIVSRHETYCVPATTIAHVIQAANVTALPASPLPLQEMTADNTRTPPPPVFVPIDRHAVKSFYKNRASPHPSPPLPSRNREYGPPAANFTRVSRHKTYASITFLMSHVPRRTTAVVPSIYP